MLRVPVDSVKAFQSGFYNGNRTVEQQLEFKTQNIVHLHLGGDDDWYV